jgi:hypothetical protein
MFSPNLAAAEPLNREPLNLFNPLNLFFHDLPNLPTRLLRLLREYALAPRAHRGVARREHP